MKVIKGNEKFLRQEDERFISLSLWKKEISVEDMQDIVNANEKLVKKVERCQR